jgi:hypothetical protein
MMFRMLGRSSIHSDGRRTREVLHWLQPGANLLGRPASMSGSDDAHVSNPAFGARLKAGPMQVLDAPEDVTMAGWRR